MLNNLRLFQYALFLILLLMSSTGSGNQTEPTDVLVGKWTGKAKIIVSWVEQDSLTIFIHIMENGQVTGKIGDAKLVEGRVEFNHWFLRFLGNSHYRISGNLEGAIIQKQNITRKSLRYILFDFGENGLEGGLHTSGGIFIKEGPKLTATGLILRKSSNIPKNRIKISNYRLDSL